VIALALLVEDARQLCGGHHQQLRQCVERTARAHGYHRVRQHADDLERDDVASVEQRQPFGEGNTQRLGIRVFRRESLAAVEPLTNSAFLPERQVAQCAPARQVFDARDQRAPVIPPAGQIAFRGVAQVLQGGPRGLAGQRDEIQRQRAHGGLEIFEHDGPQALFDARRQRLAGQLRQVEQPFGAPRQHARDEALEQRPVVVETPQDQFEGCAQFRVALRIAQGFARGDRVQVMGCVGDAAAETVTRRDRHGIRQVRIEGVDGLDAQARGALLESPGTRGRVAPHLVGQFQRHAVGVGARRQGAIERQLHALAHFARRLAGEGDGQHLLRFLDRGEQAQVALREHRGLAGAGRRLDDERAAAIERRLAGTGIGFRQLVE
jgi:hypothetical protein